jgi:hypothetical protein
MPGIDTPSPGSGRVTPTSEDIATSLEHATRRPTLSCSDRLSRFRLTNGLTLIPETLSLNDNHYVSDTDVGQRMLNSALNGREDSSAWKRIEDAELLHNHANCREA